MTVSTQTVCSLSRLRGRVGVGVPPRVIPLREPPPVAHLAMRYGLPRKREREHTVCVDTVML